MKLTRICRYASSFSYCDFHNSANSHFKPWPNDRDMPTQHVATLIWLFSNLSQQHPTCRNTSQHGGQTHATCCAQQCCDICMLRWHVAIVWPGLYISECHTAFWLPSITPSKTSARMFREDRGVSKSIKRHLNSILDEDILSDCDSEEPIEESWTNKILWWNKGV